MRVFYIVKALQIAIAAIGLYQLLSVDELCDVEEVQIEDDRSDNFEESHDGSLKSEQSVTMRATKHTETHASAKAITTKTNSARKATTAEKLRVEKLRRKANVSTTTVNSFEGTVKRLSSTADSTEEESQSNISSFISTNASPRQESDTENQSNTIEFSLEATGSFTEVSAVIDRANDDSTNMTFLKSTADKLTKEVFEKEVKRNSFLIRVHNCLPISGWDILNISDVYLPYGATFRFLFVCLLLSIAIVCYNITFSITLWKPRRFCLFLGNAAQILLCTLSGIKMLLTREVWDCTWSGVMSAAFVPQYPDSWYCAELTSFMLVVLFLAEFYFHKYIFYDIYFGKSFGRNKVIERPKGEKVYINVSESAQTTS